MRSKQSHLPAPGSQEERSRLHPALKNTHRQQDLQQDLQPGLPHPAVSGSIVRHPQQVQLLQRTIGNRAVTQGMFPGLAVVQREEEDDSWLDSATDWASDTAGDVMDTVTGGVETVAGGASEVAGDVVDTVAEGVGSAGEVVSQDWDVGSAETEAVGDAVEGAWNTVNEVGGQAVDTARSGVTTVENVADRALDAVSDTVGEAWDAIQDETSEIEGVAGDTWDTVTTGVGQVAETVSQGVGDTWEDVQADYERLRDRPEDLWTTPPRSFQTYEDFRNLITEAFPDANERLTTAEGYWALVQYYRNVAHANVEYLRERRRQFEVFKKEKRELMEKRRFLSREDFAREADRFRERWGLNPPQEETVLEEDTYQPPAPEEQQASLG